MLYIEMTAEEAMKLRGKNTKVLVSVCDTATPVSDFRRREFGECESILRNGEKIRHEVDDFMDQLRVVGSYQSVKPHKNIAVILLPPED